MAHLLKFIGLIFLLAIVDTFLPPVGHIIALGVVGACLWNAVK